MPSERIPKKALHWTPPGKSIPGHPITTTVLKELDRMGLSCGMAWEAAQTEIDADVHLYVPAGSKQISKYVLCMVVTTSKHCYCIF